MQCNNSLDYFKAFLIIFSTCGSNHKIQFREPTILKNQPERKKMIAEHRLVLNYNQEITLVKK